MTHQSFDGRLISKLKHRSLPSEREDEKTQTKVLSSTSFGRAHRRLKALVSKPQIPVLSISIDSKLSMIAFPRSIQPFNLHVRFLHQLLGPKISLQKLFPTQSSETFSKVSLPLSASLCNKPVERSSREI